MAKTGRFEPFNWRDFDPGELPNLARRQPKKRLSCTSGLTRNAEIV